MLLKLIKKKNCDNGVKEVWVSGSVSDSHDATVSCCTPVQMCFKAVDRCARTQSRTPALWGQRCGHTLFLFCPWGFVCSLSGSTLLCSDVWSTRGSKHEWYAVWGGAVLLRLVSSQMWSHLHSRGNPVQFMSYLLNGSEASSFSLQLSVRRWSSNSS